MGSILSNRVVLAGKHETTEGTAIALAGADANNLIMDPKFDADIPMFKRNFLNNSLSPQGQIATTQGGSIAFKLEAKGSGTPGTAPACGKYFRSCGMKEVVAAATSVTYTPESARASIPSMTLAAYRDGLRKLIKGARGNMKYSSKSGELGMLEFEFIGVDVDVTDVALPTPSGVETTIPPTLLSAAFSIAAFQAFVSQIQFDLSNVLQRRGDINQASGFISTLLTGREPKGSFDPEDELVATHDFYGRWKNNTTGVLTWKHGSTAGNIVTFNIPKAQYIKIAEGDRNGIATLNTDFLMQRNTTAGDDELSIAFT